MRINKLSHPDGVAVLYPELTLLAISGMIPPR